MQPFSKPISALALAGVLIASSAGLPAFAYDPFGRVAPMAPAIGHILDSTSVSIEPLGPTTRTPYDAVLASQRGNITQIRQAISSDMVASRRLNDAGYTLNDVVGFVPTGDRALIIFVRPGGF